ncbi:HlyD family secretion protein [Cupriavidus campinensis]|uniref:HlyD family secretion protein n=1 Tax=Cupriavidus campinensis TaxID=151783 RepID=A0AAE9L395_9BURK|nr:HlyD family secretion protein [Cupriavidus campinensis]URF05698.1 HlyD family secretion protein [Cupriavidus campinensis]
MSLPLSLKVGSAVVVAVAIAAAGYHLYADEGAATRQITDDAYVAADSTLVSPRVAGVVQTILVEDNQSVRAGDLLATIDDREYRVALHAANARLDAATAAQSVLDAQIRQHEKVVEQAKATVDADQASLKLAQANARRYENLAADGSGTIQERQTATAQLQIQGASVVRDEAALGAASREHTVLTARREQAAAETAAAKSAVEAAELQLSYTRIIAPIDGTVGQRDVRIGQYVNIARPLLALVPLQSAYIEAHFRETQLTRIKAGQKVDIKVDTLPGVRLTGHVDSVAPATGLSFSPIAPNNATGNFTKVVQRLTVKIKLDAGQRDAGRLKVGMSVVPTVNVDNGGPEHI